MKPEEVQQMPELREGLERKFWGPSAAPFAVFAAIGLATLFAYWGWGSDALFWIVGIFVALMLIASRWFWCIATFLAGTALALTALGYAFHFMIIESVVCVVGASVMFVIFLAISEPGSP